MRKKTGKAKVSGKSSAKMQSKVKAVDWTTESNSAIGFIRQSTPGQADGVGYEIQKQHIEDMATAMGYTITIWIYEIRSGKDMSSQSYSELLMAMTSKKHRAVFVDELSRLGRTYKRFSKAMRSAKNHSIRVLSHYEKFDSSLSLKERYRLVVAAYINPDSHIGLRRMAEAKALIKAEGGCTGGAIPFGQKRGPYGRVPDFQEMETLRMIDAMSETLSSVRIADFLIKAKRLTKNYNPETDGDLDWPPKTVRNYIEMVAEMKKNGSWNRYWGT